MMMGEYHHNIDEKGRLIIPSKFRIALGERFVITRGLDKCLFAYSMDEWNKMVEKLKELSFTKKDARSFMRMFLSGATECELDKSGRVNLPSVLTSYASINKECVIIGVNERLEIWSEDEFNNFFNENIDEFSDIAESLFDNAC